ncbi:MAG: hypothetical protein RLZZ08_1242 [Pseudomonadota bacterium]|jgi:type IV secretory pathway VirJ component
MRRVTKAGWLASFAVAVVLACSFLAYLGYWGGRVFVPLAATAAPEPALRGTVAVVLSGDMGFNIGMAPQIAERLTAAGVPVVAVNSLAYFHQRRSAADTERLIEQAARRALQGRHARSLVLIGQSYGADMLHVGLQRLPADLRARVRLVALVVPTDTVMFRASLPEWLDWVAADAPAIATAARVNWVPVLCIHGAEEGRSLCPLLHGANVHSRKLPGGHALHRDADAVFAAIRSAIILAPLPRLSALSSLSTLPSLPPIHRVSIHAN